MHEYDQEDYIEVTPDIKEENTYENGYMPSEFNEEIFSDDIEEVSYENQSVNSETNNQNTTQDPVYEDIKPVSRQIFNRKARNTVADNDYEAVKVGKITKPKTEGKNYDFDSGENIVISHFNQEIKSDELETFPYESDETMMKSNEMQERQSIGYFY
jgi:hypothetical protein